MKAYHVLAVVFVAACTYTAATPVAPFMGVTEPIAESAPAGTDIDFQVEPAPARPEGDRVPPTAVPAPKAAEGGVSTGRIFYFPYLGEGWTVENHPDGQGVTLVRGPEMVVIRPCGGLTVGDELCEGLNVYCSPAVSKAVCQEVRDGTRLE